MSARISCEENPTHYDLSCDPVFVCCVSASTSFSILKLLRGLKIVPFWECSVGIPANAFREEKTATMVDKFNADPRLYMKEQCTCLTCSFLLMSRLDNKELKQSPCFDEYDPNDLDQVESMLRNSFSL